LAILAGLPKVSDSHVDYQFFELKLIFIPLPLATRQGLPKVNQSIYKSTVFARA
jgi:hypothetical protein